MPPRIPEALLPIIVPLLKDRKNAAEVQRLLRAAGHEISVAQIRRVADWNQIELTPGQRAGTMTAEARARITGRPAIGRGQGRKFSPYRDRARELRKDGYSYQQIADRIKIEFHLKTFSKQAVAKLLADGEQEKE